MRRQLAGVFAVLASGCAAGGVPVEDAGSWHEVWAPPIQEASASRADGDTRDRLEREFVRYLSLPNQKSFAVAGDLGDRWVGGGAAGHRSALTAMQAALMDCEGRIPASQPSWECRVFAIGSRRVDEHPEMKLRYGLE